MLLGLLKQLGGLHCFLLKILAVGDETDWVHNFLVIEKHTSDLSCCLTENLGNSWIDAVADFLTALSRLQSHKALNFRIGGLLLLIHLLLHSHLRRNLLSLSWPIVLLTLTRHVTIATSPIIIKSTTLTAAIRSLIAILTRMASTVANILRAVHLSLSAREHTPQEVLLNLIEATLFTLLLKLLCRHPELDGKGSATKRCRLIESLDCALSMFNVLIEHEVFLVSSLRVKILSLAKFDRDDWANLFKMALDLLF